MLTGSNLWKLNVHQFAKCAFNELSLLEYKVAHNSNQWISPELNVTITQWSNEIFALISSMKMSDNPFVTRSFVCIVDCDNFPMKFAGKISPGPWIFHFKCKTRKSFFALSINFKFKKWIHLHSNRYFRVRALYCAQHFKSYLEDILFQLCRVVVQIFKLISLLS